MIGERSASCRRTTSVSARASAGTSRGPREQPGVDDAVGRAARDQAVQEPHPPLRIGQRLWSGAVRQGWDGGLPLARFQTGRDARHGGLLEHGSQREVRPHRLARPGHHPGRQQGVAAELEEVVVDAHSLQAQHLAPDGGQPLLGRRAGQVERGLARARAAPARAVPGGRACRSAVSGRASSRTNAAGHHVLGQAARPGASAARRRRARRRR